MYNYIRMHSIKNIKFATAQQAKPIYQHKEIKEKLHKSGVAIQHNTTCRKKQLTPKHVPFKINGTNQQCLNTVKTATDFCINQ
jgi:hypothetical protein